MRDRMQRAYRLNNKLMAAAGFSACLLLQTSAEARKFFDFALSREAQDINVRLKINSIPSNRSAALSPDAPKFSQIKLIAYDTAKYGSAAERKRLLARWTQDVQAAPK